MRATITLLALLLAVPASAALRGDLNDDGAVDVADIQCAELVALDKTPEDPATDPGCLVADALADVDCDASATVVDVQLTVFMALAWPAAGIPADQDANGDNEHDGCGGPVAGTGQPGAPCSADGDCNSSHCQNGFCCGEGDCCSVPNDCPSGYSCDAICSAPGTCQGVRYDALCTSNQCVRQAVDDDSACAQAKLCGAYKGTSCNGSGSQSSQPLACPASCSEDADCTTNHYCTGVACEPKLADGDSCASASQCAGGYCQSGACCPSGVCCDADSDCDTSGSFCSVPGQCDGLRPAQACVDGRCTKTNTLIKDDRGCAGLGKDCVNYKLAQCDDLADAADPVCPTSCTADSQCSTGSVCSSGTCSLQGDLGVGCTMDGHCASGHCADGVCCESDCQGPCRYCAHPNHKGSCLLPNNWEDPDEACPTGPGCSAGRLSPEQLCNGAGSCAYPTGALCSGDFACADGSSCRTTCTLDAHCGAGHVCQDGACLFAVSCDAQTYPCAETLDVGCSVEACDPVGGCGLANAPVGTSCTDTNPCTASDACLADGTCSGTELPSSALCCSSDTDCAANDDSNLCNGSLRCNLTNNQCELAAETVVTCQTEYTDPCIFWACEPATGKCLTNHKLDNTPCSVNYAADSVCLGGSCSLAGLFGLDLSCQTNGDCAVHQDDNLCTGPMYCDLAAGGICTVLTDFDVDCPSPPNSCQYNVCIPSTGECELKPRRVGLSCDDGDACTAGDVCGSDGTCNGGPGDCVCQQDSDCLAYDDGNLCNGILYCDQGAATHTCKVNPSTMVACWTTENTDCVTNRCDPADGQCKLTIDAAGASCSDGNSCTVNERCDKLGACVGGVNECQCANHADCAPFEDGNACNGTLFCEFASGQCQLNPSTVVTCPTAGDTACKKNRCVPSTGSCAFEILTGAPCSDGNICTTNDQCSAQGSCAGGPNLCACVSDADCADDADKCNGKLFCNEQLGRCQFTEVGTITCPSVNDTACLQNRCTPSTGLCAMVPIDGGACSDGQSCTIADQCVAGQCVPGQNQCECMVDADCPDDCDGCTGYYCDGSTKTCKLNPAQSVNCVDQTPGDCVEPICDPISAECQDTPIEACD